MREYDGDYIDACRSRVETQTAMFREVAQAARDHGDADLSGLEGALESLESEYFNNMLLVLEGYFVHRLRGVEGKDGNALNEVRVLARSLMENGGTVMEDPQIALDPERSRAGPARGGAGAPHAPAVHPPLRRLLPRARARFSATWPDSGPTDLQGDPTCPSLPCLMRWQSS